MFHTKHKKVRSSDIVLMEGACRTTNEVTLETDIADVDDEGRSLNSPLNVDDVLATRKPHFLDYDAQPPADLEQHFKRALTLSDNETATSSRTMQSVGSLDGEHLKVDKRYERDGEISDYELAASGYTKKEFTQDDNTLYLTTATSNNLAIKMTKEQPVMAKPKHFLDENPIPPDYMMLDQEHGMREHRSLDRNFERQHDQEAQQQRTESPISLRAHKSSLEFDNQIASSTTKESARPARDHAYERNGDRENERERDRFKQPSYALTRFLESCGDNVRFSSNSGPASLPLVYTKQTSNQHVPKGAAWTAENFSCASSLHASSLKSPTAMSAEDDLKMVADSFGPKVECVYSLLSMLGSNDPREMAKKFLELSRSVGTCTALRRAGCIPLLVQLMHADTSEENVRKMAGMALHNVVHSHPDEKTGRREAKVLRLLDQIIDYCNFLKTLLQSGGEAIADDSDRHPLAAMSSLMKVSFDEEHRHAMCELGALQAISHLVHLDHAVHGPRPDDQCCNSLRRYALMALTNLTFGDENNKALLCSQKLFMEALVSQLNSAPDDLLQVTASVLRNLSWRADNNMKAVLNEIGTVTALTHAAMKNRNENTLKAILSALWNLSAHCSTNKAEFCAVQGALAFLCEMLTYEGPSKTLKIIENAGGILRNVSSHIAVREHYRQILREHNCLSILLQQLKSESLTVVSNSCGTLWNLSARCPEDQKFLWDNGAVPMLRSLIHSKHAMISEGSSSALKNLLNFRPALQNQSSLDPIARSMGLKKLPSLNVRKQKALEQELGAKEHAETCDNLDVPNGGGGNAKERANVANFEALLQVQRRYPLVSGVGGAAALPSTVNTTAKAAKTTSNGRLTRSAMLTKSESRDSVFSAKSDTAYEHAMLRSQSASDSNRKRVQNPVKSYTDVETNDEIELPIDYSVKYNETRSNHNQEIASTSVAINETYQETDLDQPTDFSLRYAEHQNESEIDLIQPSVAGTSAPANVNAVKKSKIVPSNAAGSGNANNSNNNEILLILEDSVKCYQTEDTPYMISNAGSASDLRQIGKVEVEEVNKEQPIKRTAKPMAQPQLSQPNTVNHLVAYGPAGTFTPEKPVNYCEEGTPGYFSRYDSLSSLEESPPNAGAAANQASAASKKENVACSANKSPKEQQPLAMPNNSSANAIVSSIPNPNINSAQETPLMFSRYSSMDSLVEEDVGPIDDKSSVVSDFSRLASGIISPSEIPDSPTQSMPQSPRRNSMAAAQNMATNDMHSPQTPRTTSSTGAAVERRFTANSNEKRPLRSVFEDDLNRFHVENTPAQFSTATSLSNLSIIDDELNTSHESSPKQDDAHQQPDHSRKPVSPNDATIRTVENAGVSEGEEDYGEVAVANNDELLLANCINIGMNRVTNASGIKSNTREMKAHRIEPVGGILNADEPKQYYTEDTPALLSKVGSNSNLSAISICSNDIKESSLGMLADNISDLPAEKTNRLSLNLSDDMSSNASDCGAVGNQSFDILQQCIQEGMKKKTHLKTDTSTAPANTVDINTKIHSGNPGLDPISMLRRGGNPLPSYLPVADEMGKYLVEDSPCNFSAMSELSNLTVGSSLVGPAVQLKSSESAFDKNLTKNVSQNSEPEIQRAQKQHLQRPRELNENRHDDSLSSLSIESEDDTNLLSQAIAAGCNRPKSNLGFSSATASGAAKRSLSASQPIPINAANASASSLGSIVAGTHKKRELHNDNNNGNESYSSVDSSDSNDNQSKSLLELCIRTGMKKGQRSNHNRAHMLGIRGKHGGAVGGSGEPSSTTQSNPNLKQSELLVKHLQGKHPQHSSVSGNLQNQHHLHYHQRERERDRKDEKLLMECIKAGISTKTNSGSGGDINSANLANLGAIENLAVHLANTDNSVPKNVLATSAAALEMYHPTAGAVSLTATNSARSTAASDVEQEIPRNIITGRRNINNTFVISQNTEMINNINFNNQTSFSSNNSNTNNCNNNTTEETEDVTIGARVKQAAQATMAELTATMKGTENRRDQENAYSTSPNDIGSNVEDASNAIFTVNETYSSKSASFDNTSNSSDNDGGGSNESFIIEAGVTLLDRTINNQEPADHSIGDNSMKANDKHKDPDLMLKSVERLTLEFVTSAEQLRTSSLNSSNNHAIESIEKQRQHRSDSVSLSTTTTNTCPNDVSFPSVSVSLPMVASMTSDTDDADEDQATEADHKELNDFAEITPTNGEYPDGTFAIRNVTTTQPNSLGTETDTLVEDSAFETGDGASNSHSQSSGINFKLGGAVKSAAVPISVNSANKHFLYGQSHADMTNSTIIALEARALAEHLRTEAASSLDSSASSKEFGNNEDCLTFSLNSLDLDNIRPPSGMESLNISGCYQDITPRASPPQSLNGLPQHSKNAFMAQSPLFSGKSPKFPRKTLPSGLVARRALGQLPGQMMGSIESLNSSNLLDNIRPPSLMDELLDSMMSVESIQSEMADCESLATTVSITNYETATAANGIAGGACNNNDFDDNTITLHSCIEALPNDGCHDFLDDDDGAGSGKSSNDTPLPTDDCYSSAESTPRKSAKSSPCHSGIRRTLTPKQKRKIVQDRFKTYTISGAECASNHSDSIDDDATLSEEQKQLLAAASQDEVLQIEIIESVNVNVDANVPAQRRQNFNTITKRRSSQERYKTQTICYKAVEIDISGDQQNAYNSLTSTDDCPSDDMSSIRAMTKNFPLLNEPIVVTNGSDSYDEHIDSAEGCEQNSDTESCHLGNEDGVDLDIEESNFNQTGIVVNLDMDPARGKAKPTESTDAEAKAIRGRKRPTYISPYSKQYQRNNNNGNALKPPSISSTASRVSLKQRTLPIYSTSLPKTSNAEKSAPTSESRSNEISSGGQPKPLERQGTFVKDEPSLVNGNVPVVAEECATKTNTQQSPQKSSPQRTSKLPTKRPPAKPNVSSANVAALPHSRGAAGNGRKTTTTTAKTLQLAKTTTITKLTQVAKTQRSNSNASITRPNSNVAAARIAALSTRVSITTPPSRSNSNLNSNNRTAANATTGSNSNLSKIQHTQSRVSSIWKRVNDVKAKAQQQAPATSARPAVGRKAANGTNLRTQETKSSSALNNGGSNLTALPIIESPQATPGKKLVRSSTFDATPEHMKSFLPVAKVPLDSGAGGGGGGGGIGRGVGTSVQRCTSSSAVIGSSSTVAARPTTLTARNSKIANNNFRQMRCGGKQ